MMAAAASDILDGWVARRLRQETPTGAALDGLMDKLFACSVLATLVVGARLALLDALVLCTREIGEGLLVAFVLWRRPPSAGNPRAANVLGKAVTVLQFSTIVIVLLGHGACRPCVFATGACGALCAGAYWKREMGARRQAS
jgi:phosphatidylglycerophosphate synthase